MAITRDLSNSFSLTDWTEEISLLPNQWGICQNLALFSEQGVTQHSITFEEITKDGNVLVDMVRGAMPSVGKDYTRKIHSVPVPHFPGMDSIKPEDIQGKKAYGSPDEAEVLAAVRLRKMERMRQNYAWTLEKARMQLLQDGSVYAPNGTVSVNFYTEFGVVQKSVDMVFGTSTSDILGKTEEGVSHVLDNLSGENATGFVALCSPKFFAALIKHNTTKVAYQYYTASGQQQPLRERLGGNTAMYRSFSYGGVEWLECRDSYAGTQLITDGNAILLPLGTDSFRTMYSPANRFSLVNTEGMPLYMFETQVGDTEYRIEAESNFINMLARPAQVVKLTSSTW